MLNKSPNKDAGTVFTEIGGKVKLNYDIGVFSNACATRISKALNFSGEIHKIPFYKSKDTKGNDVVQVSSGGKKNWYIYRVKILIQYLTEAYGKPQPMTPSQYKKLLVGRKA